MEQAILNRQDKNIQDHEIRQIMSMTVQMLGYLSFFLLLIALADLLWPSMGLRPYLRFACHQNTSRCLLIDGHPLALCARCLGVYVGFLFWPFVRRLNRLFLLPWIVAAFGELIYRLLGGDGPNGWRLAAGLGLAYAIIIGLHGIAQLWEKWRRIRL
jgi:uncharacterized membrane protein